MTSKADRKDKDSPNYKLAKEQFSSLNKQFYNDYYNGFFLFKITDLVDKLSNPDKYFEYMKNKDLKIGKLEFNNCIQNENDIVNFARMELVDTYYHGMESFIRLFIAHASLKGCPWIEMSNLSTRTYQSDITRLANDEFDWLNKKYDGDTTVLYTLTGRDDCEAVSQEDLKGLRFWISWISEELIDHKEYNSYKHGLALFPKQSSLRLSDEGSTLISLDTDVINTLQREEKDNRFVWVKSSRYIKYDVYCTIIQVITDLINNIILVGKYHYIDADYKLGWLPNKDYNPLFVLSGENLSNSSGLQDLRCIIKGSKQELKYYK